MNYGTQFEATAWQSFQGLAPHEKLQQLGLRVWRDDDVHGWLAASPDGLITTVERDGVGGGAVSAAAGGVAEGSEVAEWLRHQTGRSREGPGRVKRPAGGPSMGRVLQSYCLLYIIACTYLQVSGSTTSFNSSLPYSSILCQPLWLFTTGDCSATVTAATMLVQIAANTETST